jgi:hypothetical protein
VHAEHIERVEIVELAHGDRSALSAMTSVLIALLSMVGRVVRSRAALHLEVLALRHRLRVLQRSRPGRLRLAKMDRWLWAWLSHSWSGWRTALVIVKPETVITWHCQGFRPQSSAAVVLTRSVAGDESGGPDVPT